MAQALSTEQREMLLRYKAAIPWKPQNGPQWEAFHSQADVLLYGGAAGGGKTSLAVGLSLTLHRETLFIRREAKQLAGVLDHIAELVDPQRKGYSSMSGEWKLPAWDGTQRKMVLGSTKNLGDEMKFQGRPRDLLVIDEAANMLRQQVEFLMGWVRSTVPGQRTRTLLCSNPPTTADGYWLIEMFAPWLDPNHGNPARPGELRYFTTIAGEMIECDDGSPFELDGEILYPKSYTFIPAKVQDNEYLGTDYLRELQALPEPLRSQMLYGDFQAGVGDSEWAVIPSAWVETAMQRWEERTMDPKTVTSVGVDPSRGGRDSTVIVARTGWHFHTPWVYEGQEMDTGGKVAAKVLEQVGESPCPVHVDVIGIGASVVDHLTAMIYHRCIPVNVAAASENATDWSGTLSFINKRAESWWRMRDLLNPANGHDVELPRSARLKAELCTPEYVVQANGIKIESKTDIIRRLGRSTDMADALILCAERTNILSVKSLKQPRIRARHSR